MPKVKYISPYIEWFQHLIHRDDKVLLQFCLYSCDNRQMSLIILNALVYSIIKNKKKRMNFHRQFLWSCGKCHSNFSGTKKKEKKGSGYSKRKQKNKYSSMVRKLRPLFSINYIPVMGFALFSTYSYCIRFVRRASIYRALVKISFRCYIFWKYMIN